MDCDERLLKQAVMTKARNPNTRVFTYRNLVKALPWFTAVRDKLTDPAYAGFFLKFKPGGSLPNGSYHVPQCDNKYSPPLCTEFYHDQEQTPEVPTHDDPSPDGSCMGTCDCGSVPCGEYLFDWRNGTQLEDWLISEVLLGATGIGSGIVDGFFIDDFWCSNIINGTGSCQDPVQGPTEIDPHSQADMGLSDQDIADITTGWLKGMTRAQQAIVNAGGYTWSLIPGQSNGAHAMRLLCVCLHMWRSCWASRLALLTSAAMICACFRLSCWLSIVLCWKLAFACITIPCLRTAILARH